MATKMGGLVLREDVGPVAVLTLNRPEKLNALSPELFLELRAYVDVLAGEGEQTRCVVLKGAGRSFSAGADIGALKAGVVTADRELRSETVERVGQLPQAVIAAVHGHCYTGGLELALAADLIIAAADTKFCDTHAKLGIVPRWGLSARLPRRVGLAVAKRLSFTAEVVDVQEALRIGLCDEVVPLQHLQDAAMRCAEKIAGNAAASIAAIKHLYQHNLGLPLAEALEYERQYTR
jgi:enoyl-CoA hydratase/carnithine racemase